MSDSEEARDVDILNISLDNLSLEDFEDMFLFHFNDHSLHFMLFGVSRFMDKIETRKDVRFLYV